MSEIHIYADSRGFGSCKSCQAKIEWAENTNTHRKIPFNDEIVPVRSYHEETTHRLIEVVDSTVSISHFATCPQSKEWRRK